MEGVAVAPLVWTDLYFFPLISLFFTFVDGIPLLLCRFVFGLLQVPLSDVSDGIRPAVSDVITQPIDSSNNSSMSSLGLEAAAESSKSFF